MKVNLSTVFTVSEFSSFENVPSVLVSSLSSWNNPIRDVKTLKQREHDILCDQMAHETKTINLGPHKITLRDSLSDSLNETKPQKKALLFDWPHYPDLESFDSSSLGPVQLPRIFSLDMRLFSVREQGLRYPWDKHTPRIPCQILCVFARHQSRVSAS